ncbi:glycosyltransferase family 2 protein [bacterium]
MLSAVVITKNEEKNIDICLKHLTWADEIIIVDSESTDKTCKIAKKYTDKIFTAKWQGFAKTKNYAISLAKGDWILSIDADEIVSDELKDEIIKTIKSDDKHGYYLPRLLYFCGKPVKHGGCYPDYQLRLFKKKSGKFEDIPVHEGVILKGIAGYLKNNILHYSYNTMFEYWDRFNRYTELDAEKKFKKGKKFCYLNIGVFVWELFKRLILKLGFLDGIPGIFYHINSSMSSFVKYSKLWELENR